MKEGLIPMANQELNNRYVDYVNDQVERIYAFKEDYESTHNNTLGNYPFAVENKYDVPQVSILKESTVGNDARYAAIEQHVQQQIVMEYFVQGQDSDVRKMYRDLQVEGSTYPADQAAVLLTEQNLVQSHEESDRALTDVLDVLEGQDHPTLERIKELRDKGVAITPSRNDAQLESIQSSMDRHYTRAIRPSDQMEELIAQAEQEARTLDNTLDNILKLEEKGVENPLNSPSVDVSNDPQVSASDRELLKLLYRNKQMGVSSASSESPASPSQGMDI